ncbi:MAG: phosphatase PAP2 family protein [Proteobacteria bacterium]|nr:phosphatase PAP2 family protein [Pseudomonadota bacterium]
MSSRLVRAEFMVANPLRISVAAPPLRQEFDGFVSCLKEAWAHAMRPAWIAVALSAMLLTLLCSITDFPFPPSGFLLRQAAVLAALAAGSVYLTRSDYLRAAVALEATMLSIAIVLIMPPLEAIFASAAFPFQDKILADADASLGIDWIALAFWFRAHPELSKILSHAYASIEWQPLVLVLTLSWADPERLRRVITTSTLVLVATIIIFLFSPAIGPYAHFKFTAADFPSIIVPAAWIAPGITEGLRNGIHQLHFAGLVTFPSYHAVVAVLLAYGWMAVPVLRWLFVPLNLLMLVSCVPIGSHYVTDVIVGIAMAWGVYPLISRYYTWADRRSPILPWSETSIGRAVKDRVRQTVPLR